MSDTGDMDVWVDCIFVRGRNALLVEADCRELMTGALHHAERVAGEALDPLESEWLAEALAGVVLLAASRPRFETHAWTIHFEEPLANVFVNASSPLGTVVGCLHREGVRRCGGNLFHAQVAVAGREPRLSMVDFRSGGAMGAVEAFFARSEQRPARLVEAGDGLYALVTAQPDCDLQWLGALTPARIRSLRSDEEVSLIERRGYRFHCGCDQGRMLDVLAPAMRADPEALFGGEETLRMRCPRCGIRHAVTREALEAHIA